MRIESLNRSGWGKVEKNNNVLRWLHNFLVVLFFSNHLFRKDKLTNTACFPEVHLFALANMHLL